MGHRDIYLVERDLQRYRKLQPHLFPALERTPDFNRYQARLASEVALALLFDTFIPGDQLTAFETAKLRTFEILHLLAKG